MRVPCADDDDGRSAVCCDDGAHDARERAALRRGEVLPKPEWLMRRLPPNTMPAQQHEATDETHTTEPYSILCYTPNSRPVREGRNIRLRIARCSMALARFHVEMPDRFWGHSANI